MSQKKTLKPLALAISTVFVGSLAATNLANAAENPFGMTSLSDSTSITMAGKDGKCGEGKCGEKDSKAKKKDGKCGAGTTKKKDGKCGAGATTKGTKDGKCGEGKCGKK